MSPNMTHRGWFWFCPIYLDLGSRELGVEARHAWLEPLFDIADLFEHARIWLTSMVVMDYEPTFMFKVTTEIKR